MTLTPPMQQLLRERLASIDVPAPARLVAPDLRCQTVEDGERLAARFGTWIRVFCELAEDARATPSDQVSLGTLADTFDKLVASLETAIHAARDRGVPWEQASEEAFADQRASVVAARKITGEGTIGPGITLITGSDVGEKTWCCGDRVRVVCGEHEGRTGTVSMLPTEEAARYFGLQDGHVRVALDGEPGQAAPGPGAVARGGRGGLPVNVAVGDLRPCEGPPGRAVGRGGAT
ncbi:MAG TPA: hypothetical protein VLE97_06420 [Gaiellaceae bacterium]|nr:hypothetical protein [Gaiellaceae bacterium]